MNQSTRIKLLNITLLLCAIFSMLSFFLQLGKTLNLWTESEPQPPPQERIISIDTTPPPQIIIHLPRQEAPKPIIVYIDSTGRTVPKAKIDTFKHKKANLYRDSIEDENLTLYYESTVKGELLNNALDYKLKIPKLITKKIEVLKPYPLPVSTMFLNGGIGGNTTQFSSIKVGLQFVSSKGWALGYDYDILQNSHNVNLGIKIFQFKPKIK
jgi:hypothetical protein